MEKSIHAKKLIIPITRNMKMEEIFADAIGMQPVAGTMNITRLQDCAKASEIKLSREEWYAIYQF
jgi:hypothetical protein